MWIEETKNGKYKFVERYEEKKALFYSKFKYIVVRKGEIIMCVSKTELDQRIRKIRNLKILRAKVDEAIEMFENEVIEFLQETPECETALFYLFES